MFHGAKLELSSCKKPFEPVSQKTCRKSVAQQRAHLLRRIGIFQKIDGSYLGSIASLNFKTKAIVKDNPYRCAEGEPEYIICQNGAGPFSPDIGFAWEKKTDLGLPYLLLHLDDPSLSKTVQAVLVKATGEEYALLWDRITINETDIEAYAEANGWNFPEPVLPAKEFDNLSRMKVAASRSFRYQGCVGA